MNESTWDSLLVNSPLAMELANIQCEACHGPGSEHNGDVTDSKMVSSLDVENCGICHDSGPYHAFPAQWKASGQDATMYDHRGFHGGHAIGAFVGYTASRSGCVACHNGAGYIQWVKEGKPTNGYGEKRHLTPRVKDLVQPVPVMTTQLREETCLVVTEDEKNTTCEVLDLDTGKVQGMQQADRYIQRLLKGMSTYTEDNGVFQLVGGLLYKVLDKNDGRRVKSHALVIPRELVDTVIINTHIELCHPGRKRLLDALTPKVYWKTMRRDVDKFIASCTQCRLKNLTAPVYSNIGVTPPSRPMKRLAVDLWSCNFGVALTALDLHSQYPFLVILEDKSSESAARAITEILAGIKTPEEILTDNGGEFTGKEFKAVLKARGIKHCQPPPYSPRSNGILERFHLFLKQCLVTSLNMTDKPTDWAWRGACLAALEAYRKTPHTSTGECPLFLATGQDPTYAIDHLLPTIPRESWNADTGTINLEQLAYAHALARRNTILAHLKHQGVKKERDPVLKAGDRVYKENLTAKKLEARWEAGYEIEEMKSSRTALVKNLKTEKTGVCQCKAFEEMHTFKATFR